jgi:hypothetical protein
MSSGFFPSQPHEMPCQGDIRPFATAARTSAFADVGSLSLPCHAQVVRASARPVDLGRLGTKTLKARVGSSNSQKPHLESLGYTWKPPNFELLIILMYFDHLDHD